MPSFDRAPAASTPCYPPPSAISSESRSSHSVTPQAGGAAYPNSMSTASYPNYHMPQNAPGAYPTATGSAVDKQQQQFAAWHAYPPPYGAYGAAYPFPPNDPSAMIQQQQAQQQAYPPMSGPGGSTPPAKKEIADGVPTRPPSSGAPSPANTIQHQASPIDNSKQETEHTEVNPIQTDFHFFVKEFMHKLREAAEAEVDASLEGKPNDYISANRQSLVHSNLNCRLMKRWEDMSQENREEFFQKEESDRKRFMEEDEVASRHCFTLTARQRSPTGEQQPNHKRPNSATPDDESPHKKTSVLASSPTPPEFFVGVS